MTNLLRQVPMFAVAAVALCGTFSAQAAQSEAPVGGPLRGVVRPLHQSAIASDLSARVDKINVREAQSFKKGDVLLAFDCERLLAEQAAAEAGYREMKVTLQSNVYLDGKGAVGKTDVEISRARADKAKAEAAALKARLKQCVVVAPFDGRVTELTINEYEIPAPGKPFISLVDETNFEIDLIVPSSYLKQISADMFFSYRIDDTGHEYRARVLRTGAIVDPVSQTLKVIGGFINPDALIISGMSGTAIFDGPGATQ